MTDDAFSFFVMGEQEFTGDNKNDLHQATYERSTDLEATTSWYGLLSLLQDDHGWCTSMELKTHEDVAMRINLMFFQSCEIQHSCISFSMTMLNRVLPDSQNLIKLALHIEMG